MASGTKLYYAYILSNPNKTLYVGVTGDLFRRVWQHLNKSDSKFVSKHGLNKLVWFEEADQIQDAIGREKQIKNWRRRWKLDLVETVNPRWLDLAQGWYDDCPIGGWKSLRLTPFTVANNKAPEPTAISDPDRATEPASEEEATRLWTEYLTNTIQEKANKEVYFHFCEGGFIYTTNGNDLDLGVDIPNSWSVGRNTAMSSSRWWETNVYALVTYYTRGLEQDTTATLGIEDGVVMGAFEPYEVYESECCKQRS